MFASSRAIDFAPFTASRRTALFGLSSLVRPEPPEHSPAGLPVLAPLDGEVIAVHDAEPHHVAHCGLPSIGYALA